MKNAYNECIGSKLFCTKIKLSFKNVFISKGRKIDMNREQKQRERFAIHLFIPRMSTIVRAEPGLNPKARICVQLSHVEDSKPVSAAINEDLQELH